jgi:diguanylate cyclase (GGDEF)-like protein
LIVEHPFEHREHQPLGCVSVSIGAACFPAHAHDKASLLATADTMLYQAKRTGRSRVCAPPDVPTAPK